MFQHAFSCCTPQCMNLYSHYPLLLQPKLLHITAILCRKKEMWHFWHKIQENFPGDKQNISQQIRVSLFCFVSFCNIKLVKAIKSFEMYMYLKRGEKGDETNETQQPKGNIPFADHMWGLNYANWIIYIIQTTRESNKNAFQFFFSVNNKCTIFYHTHLSSSWQIKLWHGFNNHEWDI